MSSLSERKLNKQKSPSAERREEIDALKFEDVIELDATDASALVSSQSNTAVLSQADDPSDTDADANTSPVSARIVSTGGTTVDLQVTLHAMQATMATILTRNERLDSELSVVRAQLDRMETLMSTIAGRLPAELGIEADATPSQVEDSFSEAETSAPQSAAASVVVPLRPATPVRRVALPIPGSNYVSPLMYMSRSPPRARPITRQHPDAGPLATSTPIPALAHPPSPTTAPTTLPATAPAPSSTEPTTIAAAVETRNFRRVPLRRQGAFVDSSDCEILNNARMFNSEAEFAAYRAATYRPSPSPPVLQTARSSREGEPANGAGPSTAITTATATTTAPTPSSSEVATGPFRRVPLRRQGAFIGTPDWEAMNDVRGLSEAELAEREAREARAAARNSAPAPPVSETRKRTREDGQGPSAASGSNTRRRTASDAWSMIVHTGRSRRRRGKSDGEASPVKRRKFDDRTH